MSRKSEPRYWYIDTLTSNWWPCFCFAHHLFIRPSKGRIIQNPQALLPDLWCITPFFSMLATPPIWHRVERVHRFSGRKGRSDGTKNVLEAKRNSPRTRRTLSGDRVIRIDYLRVLHPKPWRKIKGPKNKLIRGPITRVLNLTLLSDFVF